MGIIIILVTDKTDKINVISFNLGGNLELNNDDKKNLPQVKWAINLNLVCDENKLAIYNALESFEGRFTDSVFGWLMPSRGQRDIDIDIDDIGHYRYRHRYWVTVDIDIDIFIDNHFFLIFCENHLFLVCCDTKLHVNH